MDESVTRLHVPLCSACVIVLRLVRDKARDEGRDEHAAIEEAARSIHCTRVALERHDEAARARLRRAWETKHGR